MNPEHARFADWDAAYVLGALSPTERRDYEEHVATCETCGRAIAELTPMPGLLGRLSPERGRALLDETAEAAPPAEARSGILDGVRQQQNRHVARRRRRLRAIAAVAVAAVAVVLAVVVVPLAVGHPDADARSFALEAVTDTPLTASAKLTPVAWGTRIDLECLYAADASVQAPPDGWPYELVVVGRDGARSDVSSWNASPGAAATVGAGTALRLDEIASIEIAAVQSGDVLMRVEVE